MVIINEHHARPRHRVFIRELIVRLREEGFTHYAAEAMGSSWAEREGYPQVGDGYYTTEPMMARLFEHARRLGYQQVQYEAKLDQIAPLDADVMVQIEVREEAQAQNLMDAVLTTNPETKIIIHVGHGHVAETPVPDESGTPWMAARLKAKSGLDPLTISQTDCRSDGATAVLSEVASEPGGRIQPMHTDYLIGLPAMEFTNGRPNYRYEMGDQAIAVPDALRPVTRPVLIEARPPGADLDQEPIERLYLAPGEDLPLMLPPGIWSLVSIDDSGAVSTAVEVEVVPTSHSENTDALTRAN